MAESCPGESILICRELRVGQLQHVRGQPQRRTFGAVECASSQVETRDEEAGARFNQMLFGRHEPLVNQCRVIAAVKAVGKSERWASPSFVDC